MKNNVIAFIAGFVLATLLSVASAAVLGTMHDNEMGKFFLDGDDNICVRQETTEVGTILMLKVQPTADTYGKVVTSGDWLTIPFSGVMHSPSTNSGSTIFRFDEDDDEVVTLPKGSSFPVTRVLLNKIEVKTGAGDYVLVYGGSW